jgi:hypothetical protein
MAPVCRPPYKYPRQTKEYSTTGKVAYFCPYAHQKKIHQ